jgi:hypothetical protein
MIINYSCVLDSESETITEAPYHPVIKLKVNFINNSDLTFDYSINNVEIGVTGLDNTPDIFRNYEEYLNFKNRYSINEDFKETPVIISGEGRFDDVNYKGIVLVDSSDDLIYYEDNMLRPLSSISVKIKFSNNIEKILAGWPKYYYSKLSNVVKYGFCYNFVNFDKKIWDYWTGTEPYITFSIDSDDSNGNIRGYLKNTLYSLRVTINSPDNIIFEVLPETGESF